MMSLYVMLTPAVLAIATWIAALKLALLRPSRVMVTHRLEIAGRESSARWLSRNFDAAILTLSLLRTFARLAVFVLVLAATVEPGTEAPLSWPDLAISGVISVMLLWVFTSVLAAALARHVGAGLVSSGLPIIRFVTQICWPLTKAVSFIDEVVRRLSGANLLDDDETEAELLRSIDRTQREGGLDEAAADMLENVVEFTNTDVAEIMTPRTDIEGIELTDDLSEIRAFIDEVGHSRIPVYRENLDTILDVEIDETVATGNNHRLYTRLMGGPSLPGCQIEIDVSAHPYEVMGIAARRDWRVALSMEKTVAIPIRRP